MAKKKSVSRRCNSRHEPATKQELHQMEKRIMKSITDFQKATQENLDVLGTTLDSIASGIVALDDLITKLQSSPGTLSAEDQAALDAIQSASAALVTKASAISVTPPVTPAP
jgi:hypothetical protein